MTHATPVKQYPARSFSPTTWTVAAATTVTVLRPVIPIPTPIPTPTPNPNPNPNPTLNPNPNLNPIPPQTPPPARRHVYSCVTSPSTQPNNLSSNTSNLSAKSLSPTFRLTTLKSKKVSFCFIFRFSLRYWLLTRSFVILFCFASLRFASLRSFPFPGFGFVTFASPSSVPTAIATLDNKSFQGRIIRVHNAKQSEEENSKESKDDENDKSSLTYKKKKEIERKEKADQAYGWNASYIRSDAVVDSLASRLNVEKGAILDHTQGNMAVRLALGETEIIQENRDFLQAHGIDLDVMETKKTSRKGNSSNRSVTMLLVKNLPFNTSEDDIRNLFVNFGELKKLKVSSEEPEKKTRND